MIDKLQLLLEHIRRGITTQNDEAPILAMVNALDFYATQTNYLPFNLAGQSPIDLDNGEKDREALGL